MTGVTVRWEWTLFGQKLKTKLPPFIHFLDLNSLLFDQVSQPYFVKLLQTSVRFIT